MREDDPLDLLLRDTASVTYAEIVRLKKLLDEQEAEKARVEAQLRVVQAAAEKAAASDAYARWDMLGTLLDLHDAP